jgi:excisionase family DNA binding protein
MNTGKTVLTEAEFSKLVRLSRTTLWQLRKQGKLPHCRVGTKILYRLEHADELMRSLEYQHSRRR